MKKFEVEQSGRSMIEMLGVLAIVGVLSVAGIAGYSKAMGKFKNSKVMDQVSTLSANIKTQFASMGTYTPLTGELRAFNLGLFPEDMVKTCTSESCDPTHGMNGGAKVLGGAGSFEILFMGLPKESCVSLLTSDWGGSAGFRGMDLSSTDSITIPSSFIAGGNTCVKTVRTPSAECLSQKGNAIARDYCADGVSVGWVFY